VATGGEASQPGGWWGGAYGASGQVKGDGDAHSLRQQSGGFMLGAEHSLGKDATLGAALDYGHTELSVKGLNQSATLDAFSVGLYGEERMGSVFVDAASSLGYLADTTTRHILLPGINRRATGGTDGVDGGLLVSAGSRLNAPGGWRFEPSAGLVYSFVWQNGFTEAGAGGADLAVDSRSQSALQSRIGARVFKPLTLADGALSLEGRAFWSHELSGRLTPVTGERFAAAPGTDFTVAGVSPGRDAAIFGARVAYRLSSRVRLSGGYDGAWSDRGSSNAVSLSGQIVW
jgi:outer membrane autotransporter protein